jgi:hypothetical protein
MVLGAASSCKKDAVLPPEVRPDIFYFRCTLIDSTGQAQPHEYRARQQIPTGMMGGGRELILTLVYWSGYHIAAAGQKSIRGGLRTNHFGADLASIELRRDERADDLLEPPEWRRAELEELLQPGRVFRFGDEPGEAQVRWRRWDESEFLSSSARSNASGFLRLETVEDYGSPPVGIPYFGKVARFRFAGEFYRDGQPCRVEDGEALLFFRYYNF